MSWRDPVDVSDEATVRRSEGGFTEPLPARAQDGDMSIPETGYEDPRYPKRRPGPDDASEAVRETFTPWAVVEADAKTQLADELGAARDHALRASKWAKILADVDTETTEELTTLAERLRKVDERLAKGPE